MKKRIIGKVGLLKAEKVSMNKLLHLEGMLGELKILIPFAKISILKSFRKQNKKLFLDVQLVGGKKLKLEVAKRYPCSRNCELWKFSGVSNGFI